MQDLKKAQKEEVDLPPDPRIVAAMKLPDPPKEVNNPWMAFRLDRRGLEAAPDSESKERHSHV